MAAGIPERKANKLIGEINALRSTLDPDDFTWKRIWREADWLQREDAEEAFVLKGALHSIRGETGKMIEHYERAFLVGGRADDWAHGNYACSLRDAGMFADAAKQREKERGLAGLDKEVFEKLANTYISGGYLTEADKLCAELAESDNHCPHEEIISDIDAAKRVLESHKVTETDLQSAIVEAVRFLRSTEVRYRHVSDQLRTELGEAWISHLFIIASDSRLSATELQIGFTEHAVEHDLKAVIAGAVTFVFTQSSAVKVQ